MDNRPQTMRPRSPRARSISLRNRLIVIFIAVAILPALAISVWTIAVEYSNGRQQALHRLQSTSSLKSLELASWLNGRQGELAVPLREEFGFERASTVLKVEGKIKFYDFYVKALRNRLLLYISQSQQLQEIFLLNPQGEIVLSTDESHEGEVFLGALKPPLPPCIFKDEVAYILNPIVDQDNRLMGALVGRARLDEVNSILKEASGLGATGKAYLLDSQLALQAASFDQPLDPSAWDMQVNAFDASGLGPKIAGQIDSQAIYTDYANNLVISFYHWIPEIQAGMMVEQNLSEAFATLFSTLAVSLGIMLSAILLAVTASWMTTRQIAHPIENLAAAANRIAHGDLEQTVAVEKRDEIGVLAEAFNIMTAQLRNLINGLELRVEERTQVLKQRALQLETSARVSREVTSILDIGELLARVVELIRDTFGYQHTSIYLIDETSRQLVYQAGTQDPHLSTLSLAAGENSINRASIQSNAPVLIRDTSQDARFQADEPLQQTQSELVIPLRVGEYTIGTLDVQSRDKDAFMPEDVLLLQSLGDQIAIAIENARLYKRNRELAVLEERNRLARDLHDSVSQSLYSLSLMAEGWKRLVKAGKEGSVENYASRFAEITQQALKEMRLLIYEMRSPALDQEGLLGALRQRLDAVERHAGVETHFIVDELISLPTPIEEALYWIAQESLNNALKHADASQVSVHLYVRDSNVVLDVTDNGKGFDPSGPARSYGLGLKTMQERAERISSVLLIRSMPGKGTTVSIQVPILPNQAHKPGTPTDEI